MHLLTWFCLEMVSHKIALDYLSAEVVREVSLIVYDEIHYLRDKVGELVIHRLIDLQCFCSEMRCTEG